VAQRFIFNDRIDAAVAAFFMISVIIIIIADGASVWYKVVSGRMPAVSIDVPFDPGVADSRRRCHSLLRSCRACRYGSARQFVRSERLKTGTIGRLLHGGGMRSIRAASGWTLLILGVMQVTGCASWGKKETGAAAGAAAGGVIGGVIGHQTGSTARGAIIGAVVGGAAGAIIGHQMDQQAKELQQNIPGATVTRVGEGIAVTFTSGLLYDFDSDLIKPTAAQNLRSLAQSLGKYPNTDILIVGHTDATGSDSYNQGLSERRARSAQNFLVGEGVAATRLRSAGRGETEPIASNDNETGQAQNRRVEVAIYANDAARRP